MMISQRQLSGVLFLNLNSGGKGYVGGIPNGVERLMQGVFGPNQK
jgi:hypothetical protein